MKSPTENTDYIKFRGKCRELSERYVDLHPDHQIVKGWYHCPIWGKQPHWWTQNIFTGKIHDPSVKQFPSKGLGEYEEYMGILECEYCGKKVSEDEAYFVDQHIYCCYEHYGRDVM